MSYCKENQGRQVQKQVKNFLTILVTKNETGPKIIIMQMDWLLSLVFSNVPEYKNQQSTISYFGLSTVGVPPSPFVDIVSMLIIANYLAKTTNNLFSFHFT